ncbi:hypothetical protein SteCoe_28573 [Stentor coeruleus]|uniref:Uncharacterized protein n=1 Tax=Stentor coeruleus TaxID=5963 RepID=A0A1R2B7Y9_9CILI|nr:hypothetical protein SteCoe_28573 [Stentor coeruleus]
MKQTSEIKEVLEFIVNTGYNHPLVVQACSELSLKPDDLSSKPTTLLAANSNNPINKDLGDIYNKHHEARRRAKLIIIAKYLLENNFLTTIGRPISQMARSLSASNTNRPKSTHSAKDEQEIKVENIKKKIIKKINVEKNLKKLKIEDETRRKNFESKLYAKSCRSNRKIMNESKTRFEKHDKRIKEILLKKQKKLEENEKNALSYMSMPKDEFKTVYNSFHSMEKASTPGKRISRMHYIDENDDSINQQLDEFKFRMDKSAQRAQKALKEKANSGNLVSVNANKVKLAKEFIEIETEKKNIEKLSSMRQKFVDSNKRRDDLLSREQRRIAISIKGQETRLITEKIRQEKAQADKEMNLEQKSAKKEKNIKEIKELIDKNIKMTSYKAQIRKRDQESNLKKLQKDFQKIRDKLIDKIKESDANRSKCEPDIRLMVKKYTEEILQGK